LRAEAQDPVGRVGLDLGRGAVGDDLAAVHHDDPARVRVRLIKVVRGEQHRGAVLANRLHRSPEGAAGLDVQRRRGLVEEQQFRVTGQREREPDALCLPTGKLLHPAVRQVCDPSQPQQAGRWPAVVEELLEQADRLAHFGSLGQPAGLQHAADLARGGRRRGPPAQDPDLSGGRCAQAEHEIDRGGLAGAVRAEQRDRLAAADVEGHVVQGADIRVVHLDNVAERDGHLAGPRVLGSHDFTLGAPEAGALSRASRPWDDRCHGAGR
jgi:hypothetical protein